MSLYNIDMYTTYNTKELAGFSRRSNLSQYPYSIYNPPAYYQSIAPNQVPVQTWPYMGPGGASSPYGPWSGFYLGQRIIDTDDANRLIKEKQQEMIRRAQTSSDPVEKYITAEGILDTKLLQAFKDLKEAKPATKKATKSIKKDDKKKTDTKKDKELSGIPVFITAAAPIAKWLIIITIVVTIGYFVKKFWS